MPLESSEQRQGPNTNSQTNTNARTNKLIMSVAKVRDADETGAEDAHEAAFISKFNDRRSPF